MSILEELNSRLTQKGFPVETGIFSEEAPDTYIVITPLSDTFDLHADNAPGVDIQEARLSLFTKGSYTAMKNNIVRMLLREDFTITDRLYNGYEIATGYHHYTVDVARFYEYEMEE